MQNIEIDDTVLAESLKGTILEAARVSDSKADWNTPGVIIERSYQEAFEMGFVEDAMSLEDAWEACLNSEETDHE